MIVKQQIGNTYRASIGYIINPSSTLVNGYYHNCYVILKMDKIDDNKCLALVAIADVNPLYVSTYFRGKDAQIITMDKYGGNISVLRTFKKGANRIICRNIYDLIKSKLIKK